MRFLVVGYPRSGTGFMSAMFKMRGFDVHHEIMGKDGTSDWMLSDRIDQFAGWEIIHVIRDPLKSIESNFLTTSLQSYEIIANALCMPYQRSLNSTAIGWVNWHKMIISTGMVNHTVRVEHKEDFDGINDITSSCLFPPTDTNARAHRQLSPQEWASVDDAVMEEVLRIRDSYYEGR